MKRHVLAVLCIGAVLGASVAWTQDPLGFELNTDLINDLSPNVEDTPSRVRDDELREQLLRLVEEKARLMDREALEEALSEVQDDIGELQAMRKVEEAQRILSSIIDEHVGTVGAATARRMLHTVATSDSAVRFAIVGSGSSEESSHGYTELSESELREQLLRLVEEQAQLMDGVALEEALSEVQDDIAELQARQKLEEARELLNSILEEHEETEGARRAQRMLETDDEPLSAPTASNPFFNPI